MNIARQLLLVAQEIIAAETNGLNGLTNRQARGMVNKIMDRHKKGIFSDQYWKPVHAIFRDLTRNGVPYVIEKTEYLKDREGRPNAKVWSISIPFSNEKQRETTLYGTITASGAGSVEEPLESYDLTAYVN